MNNENAQGKMDQLNGKIKQKWGQLTDNDIQSIKGNAQALAGKLEERYGMLKDRAKQEATDFLKSIQGDGEVLNFEAIKDEVTKKAEEVTDTVVKYVKEQPLKSMGIAFAAGLIISLITRR